MFEYYLWPICGTNQNCSVFSRNVYSIGSPAMSYCCVHLCIMCSLVYIYIYIQINTTMNTTIAHGLSMVYSLIIKYFPSLSSLLRTRLARYFMIKILHSLARGILHSIFFFMSGSKIIMTILSHHCEILTCVSFTHIERHYYAKSIK